MRRAAYQEKEVFEINGNSIECCVCSFSIELPDKINFWDLWAAHDQVEFHYVQEHCVDPSVEMVKAWLQRNLPFSGKLRLIRQCIDDLNLKYFRAKYPYEGIRYSTELAKILNRLKDEEFFSWEYKGRGYAYQFKLS